MYFGGRRASLAVLFLTKCLAEWTLYTDVNCYNAHGGDDLEALPGKPCGIMSFDECKQKCEEMPSCQGITMEISTKKCYRRGGIDIPKCDKGGFTASGYNTWVGPIATTSWGFATTGNITVLPTTGDDGTIYVSSQGQSIYAVGANGSLGWEFAAGGRIFSVPLVGKHGNVYVASCNSTASHMRDNRTVARAGQTVGREYYGSCQKRTASGGINIGIATTLHAVDANGAVKWQFTAPGDLLIQDNFVLLDNGIIYLTVADGSSWNVNNSGSMHALNVADGSEVFKPILFDPDEGPPALFAPAIAKDGTAFFTIYNRRMECTFVRIRANGTKDVLYNRTWKLDNCLPPQIGSDGTIHVVLPDGLMALDSQANLLWTYKLQGLHRGDFVIRSFMLGANGTVFLTAVTSESSTLGSQSPPPVPKRFVAWQGVDKSGKLMWTLQPPSDKSWYHWTVSEKGEPFFIESVTQPTPSYPSGQYPPPISNRVSLVRLDINGQISLNITLQGSPFLSFDVSGYEYDYDVSVNSVGDVIILACARTSFDVGGHAVWYVVPRDGKNGWSFTPRNAPCGFTGNAMTVSTLHGSRSKDDALFAVSGDLLYKVIRPSMVGASEVSDPWLVV